MQQSKLSWLGLLAAEWRDGFPGWGRVTQKRYVGRLFFENIAAIIIIG